MDNHNFERKITGLSLPSVMMHGELAGLVSFGAPKAVNREAASAIGCPVRRYVVKGAFAALHAG